MSQPFFTIGVTTYKRRELLKQTLLSIANQTFADFEVIIGNDYTDEILANELLGIDDPRFRYVNHPTNLKETGNMNSLLGMASGRYFTWLADDDLYHPDFLRNCHELLTSHGFPPAIFTSFRIFHGEDAPAFTTAETGAVCELSGREFLARYFSGRLRIIGVYGIFEADRLKSVVRGVEDLCESSVGLYGEYIFLVRAALLGRIVYTDATLIHYRGHDGSWSKTNIELDKYLQAGENLVRRSAEVLRDASLAPGRTASLLGICNIHLTLFAGKSAALEIAQGSVGFKGLCRSLARFAAEKKKIRNIFKEESGGGGIRMLAGFFLMTVKGYYIIVGMLGLRRSKSLFRLNDTPGC